jgi:hypothetical protein
MISKRAWRFLLFCYFSPPLILIGIIFALGFYYRPTVEYAYVDALDLRETAPMPFFQRLLWLGIPAAVLAYVAGGVALVVATIRRRRRA